MNNKKMYIILGIFAIIFTFFGGTLSYWQWNTNTQQQTVVNFTVENDFSCAVDGGGDITSNDVMLAPSSCMNSEYAIRREIKVMPTITGANLDSIVMDLWLDVDDIGSGLSASQNFRYALTTYENSCTTGVVSSGTFNGIEKNEKVNILSEIYNNTMIDTYYLYIWLDVSESSDSTMNEEFSLSLNGSCTNNSNIVNDVDDLQRKYEFDYYSTLNLAVSDVNNGTIGENADSTIDEAVAGIYVNDGKTNVVLLKDTSLSSRIEFLTDMTFNLGGNELTFNDSVVGLSIPSSASSNVVVDGRLEESTINIFGSNGNKAKAIQFFAGNSEIIGGVYNCESDGMVHGITVNHGALLVISDSEIVSRSDGNKTAGINNFGTSVVNNLNISTYADYNVCEDDSDEFYCALSTGIANNSGSLTVNNSYVMGTHSGIQNNAVLSVNGGIYEGFDYGGIYFSGASSISYVKDAMLRECDMPDGYVTNYESKNSGVVINATNLGDNISVYMNNCDIYGSENPIILSGNNTEYSSNLYMSYSRINSDKNIKIDNDTHKLYLGVGNNFSDLSTTLPSMVINTNEVYVSE